MKNILAITVALIASGCDYSEMFDKGSKVPAYVVKDSNNKCRILVTQDTAFFVKTIPSFTAVIEGCK